MAEIPKPEIGIPNPWPLAQHFRLVLSGVFLVLVFVLTRSYIPASTNGLLLVIAAVIGGYMALNIGANDVGPTVGANALTIFWAVVIAAICEAAGAIIAGGEVVNTVKKGIIKPDLIGTTDEFIWLMMAALLTASIWLNLATLPAHRFPPLTPLSAEYWARDSRPAAWRWRTGRG